jgi:hypothetical protein
VVAGLRRAEDLSGYSKPGHILEQCMLAVVDPKDVGISILGVPSHHPPDGDVTAI